MAIQTMIPVDKQSVSAVISLMHNYIRCANDIHLDASYIKIADSRSNLRRAQGMYEAMSILDLLPAGDSSGEDLERIDAKIKDIYEQKRRSDYPRWRISI